MALRIKSDETQIRIQFVLPDDIHDGQVSAVGSFNDWKPGVHSWSAGATGPGASRWRCRPASPSSSAISARAVSGSTTRMPTPSPQRDRSYASEACLFPHRARSRRPLNRSESVAR